MLLKMFYQMNPETRDFELLMENTYSPFNFICYIAMY